MTETREARLKRMRMRSWRRGTKEMDMILGPFADQHLAELSEADLVQYDQVLNQNDQDLYPWVSGQRSAPDDLETMLGRIADFSNARV